jgi:poly(A) polymerase
VNAKLDASAHSWMNDAPVRAVMRALTADGGAARFVGGAVRNALLGEPVGDVDIATPLHPDEVVRRLEAAGLGAVPTGIEHGTVTAVSGGKPFEVTTLRRDVETFGRRAVVAYTTDWAEDAGRRDFTMNALYAGEDGAIYDYFGGLADLAARRVRFVGDARTRIREDYLRILRLFRFHAWYGKGEIDSDALAAAEAEKAGLKLLSGERVQKELLRLLEAHDPMPALNAMAHAEILPEIVPHTMIGVLANLVRIQRDHDFAPEPILRLAALMPHWEAARDAARHLRLSKNDSVRLIAAHTRDQGVKPHFDDKYARQSIYNMGASGFRDVVMLRWARAGADATEWRKWESLSHSWVRPDFPLSGRDAMALGLPEGPKVGALLDKIKKWWIAEDFVPARDELLARLKAEATNIS